LDDLVQGLQIGRAAHGDAPPDQRLDVGQFDAQDGEFFALFMPPAWQLNVPNFREKLGQKVDQTRGR
jgi:hypothetical protein